MTIKEIGRVAGLVVGHSFRNRDVSALISLRWILTRANFFEFFIFQCCLLNQMCYMYIVSCVGRWLYVKFILTPFLYITLLNTGMTCTFIPIVFAFTIWVYLVYDDSEYIHDIRILLEDDHYRIYIYIPYCRNHTMF